MSSAWNAITGQAQAPQASQWGAGNSAADLQQKQQKGLGGQAVTQGLNYAGQAGAQGQQYGQQFGALGQGYGAQAGQQYGQFQGNQVDQYRALDNLANAAQGRGPSAANSVMSQGLGNAINAEQAMANSSRGGFGLANAQRNATNASANLMAQNDQNAAQLRAQEQQAAQQAYMQGSLGMGQQSLGAMQGSQNNQLAATQAGANSQLGYMQSGQNAVTSGEGLQQGYEGQGLGVQNASAGQQMGNAQLQAQQQQANAQAGSALIGGAIGAVATGGASLLAPAAGAAIGGMGAGGGPLTAESGGDSGGFGSIPSDERVKRDVASASHASGYEQGVRAATSPQAMSVQRDMPPVIGNAGQMYVLSPHGYLPAKAQQMPAPGSYQAGVADATKPTALAVQRDMPPVLGNAGEMQVLGPSGYVDAGAPMPAPGPVPSDERIKRDIRPAGGVREPGEFTRIREAPTVDPEADNASVVQYEEKWRPPPPTLDERRVAGLGELASMRDQALSALGPGRELQAARAEPPVDRFLGSLEPKTYAYADPRYEPNPAGQGDRYLGIMAQDLERTPEGRKLVSPGTDGVKRVNVPALAGASAAALGRLHERLAKLEGRQRAGVR